jgi:hypothetical protein
MGLIDSIKEALGGDRDEQTDASAPSDGNPAESAADYPAGFARDYAADYAAEDLADSSADDPDYTADFSGDYSAGPADVDTPGPRHAALDAPDENPDDEWLVTGGKHAARDRSPSAG